MNKENRNKLKSKTRIPIPIEPLPAIPKHLYTVTKTQEITSHEEHRLPLKTINTLSGVLAEPKRRGKIIPYKPKSPFKIDTRYVTQRRSSDDLDWNYNVFKDKENKKGTNVKIYDESEDKENCVGEAKRAVTPVAKSSPLEPNKVKNIKRSLKRPHSRELQGISPLVHPEKKGEEKFKRRLNFSDRLHDTLQSPDYWKKSYTKCIERDYAKDLFPYLLSAERPASVPRIPSITRACVLNWLMKVNGVDGNPAVVQTASWYLDSVLNVSSVQIDTLQPVAAACYWIAQKLHGPVAPASRLIKCSNKAFDFKHLLRAEKAILNRLKFPPQPIVPQDYITYLAWWADSAKPGEIEVAATFLCMCALMVDKKICNELPSVVAAACVRNALLMLRKREFLLRLQNCPVYQAVQKKTRNGCSICSALHRAVRIVGSAKYQYKAPLEIFGISPHFIAQKIVTYVNEFTDINTQ